MARSKSKPVELSALTDGVLQTRQLEAAARGIHITQDLRPVRLCGNPRLLERLVGNLVDNALRHNAPGGGVTVTTSTREGVPRLSVANDGPVVRPEDIERLYEPFERLDGLRPSGAEGFGLGLCIVKAVASAHGAALDTQPRPSGGLRVEVRFPAYPS